MRADAPRTVEWNPERTDDKLQAALRTLGEEYPISEAAGGAPGICFESGLQDGSYRIERRGREIIVRYGGGADAIRAVGSLMAGLGEDDGGLAEQSPFSTMGIMLDCSRNAVMRVGHFKRWLRRLALLGYNMAMLYTEDTYELPGEPYFGYQRGAYTADELREIDDYAALLGIEMIPCIQTLGHLEHLLKWPAYHEVVDDRSVLLIDEPKTYELIDKMLAHWSSVYRSRRIHVGMDECWSLGLGRYVKRFGYVPGVELFLRHIEKVAGLCAGHGLEPMIWSDMFFRFGSTAEYNVDYDSGSVVPQEVIRRIPESLRLVYWQYHKTDKDVYVDWIGRHRALGSEPIMAAGLATSGKLWQDAALRYPAVSACMEGCKETNLKEIFVCLWGGATCDFDSALTGLAYAAERAYARNVDDDVLAARFGAVCGADYDAVTTACEINTDGLSALNALWDDPLLGIYVGQQKAKDESILAAAGRHYEALAEKLAPHADDRQAGDLNHARLIAEALAAKLSLADRLGDAYGRGDRETLAEACDDIPRVSGALRALLASFRTMWMSHNKPQGFEVTQVRLAGLIERYGELSQRIEEYLAGTVDGIAELDANLPHTPQGAC